MNRYAGQVGYLYAGMKNATEAQIGDTFYHQNKPVEPLPGFKLAKPMVGPLVQEYMEYIIYNEW